MTLLLVLLLLIVVLQNPFESFSNTTRNPKQDLRKLFSERAIWLKSFIEDSMKSNADKNSIRNRLIKNHGDIGSYLNDKFTHLFVNHGNLLMALIHQIQTQRVNEITIAMKALEKSSKKIGIFLNNLPHAEQHFNKQNQFIFDMATAHFFNDHKKEITASDEFYNHSLKLSDLLAGF